MIYIFDIDGTLADLSHRLHFIQEKPADWRKFFAACPKDKPIAEVVRLAQILEAAGAFIVFITGRSDEVRPQTKRWLQRHLGFNQDLYMRKAGDHREDHIVKAELLDAVRAEWAGTNKGDCLGVFEDRKQVVDMYRAKGLRVFQVAEGNF